MQIVVTGHRPQSLGGFNQKELFRKIKEEARTHLTDRKPDHVITGMALGWDTWIAEVCFEEGIEFTAAVPFQGQENKWPPKSQAHYRWLLSKASRVVCVDEIPEYIIDNIAPGVYHPSKMHRRNEWMVDQMEEHDELYALWNGNNRGGTFSCITYFRGIHTPNVRLYQFNPDTLDDVPF